MTKSVTKSFTVIKRTHLLKTCERFKYIINLYIMKEGLDRLTSEELNNLKKGQHIISDMLKEIDTICRRYDISYWCIGGTLIGAIRHKGWIPHDADVDIGMLQNDYNKLRTVIQGELPDRYWFQDQTTDKHYKAYCGKLRYLDSNYIDYKCEDWHNGLQVDIFIHTEDDTYLSAGPCNILLYNSNKIRKDNIFPLKELLFEDILVYVPGNYQQVCKQKWGCFPPPILPKAKQYPHEGRMSFIVPQWMKNKYPHLYSCQ